MFVFSRSGDSLIENHGVGFLFRECGILPSDNLNEKNNYESLK